MSFKFARVRSSVIAVLAMLTLTGSALAAPRGGIQAVLFSRWSDASTWKLVETLNEVRPQSFELSQAPFFKARNPFDNTLVFLNGINDQTQIVLTFFMSFKDEGNPDLADRARQLNRFLLDPAVRGGRTPLDRAMRVVLSPQLEDIYGTGGDRANQIWKGNMRQILRELDPRILQSGKLKLRRSPRPDDFRSLGDALQVGSLGFQGLTFRVGFEVHGADAPASGVWSNDGVFVFRRNSLDGFRETKNSQIDLLNLPPLSMKNFLERATGVGVVNLWRPAYNLFDRNYDPPSCPQAKPRPAGDVVTWTRRPNDPASGRDDPCMTGFDERERLVLTHFLLNLR